MRAAIVACRVAGTSTSAAHRRDTRRRRARPQHAAFGEIAHDLLGEERIAGGPFGDVAAPTRATDGSSPSSSVISVDDLLNHSSGASAIVCAPGIRAKRAAVFRAVGDQHQQRRLRDDRKKVGEHRLAGLVDPVRVLDDVDRRVVRASAAALISAVNRRRRASAAISGSRDVGVPDAQQVVEQEQILGIGIGEPVAIACAGGTRRPSPSTPTSRATARDDVERDVAGVRFAVGREHVDIRAAARRFATSRISRLLPIPGGPTTPTTHPCAVDRPHRESP